MAIFPRATFFFQDNTSAWTETYYGNSVTDIGTMQANASKLANIRCKMILSGPQLVYGRVSMDDIAGDSLMIDVPQAYADGSYNKDLASYSPDVSDFSYSTLLLRMQAGSLYRKSTYLSGCPDQSQGPYKTLPNNFFAPWMKAYNAFVFEMTSGRWGIKALSKDLTQSPIKQVANFVNLAGVATCTSPAHGLVKGDRVRIWGCKGIISPDGVSINGTWNVDAVPNADSFTLLGYPANSIYALQKAGNVRKQVYTTAAITSVSMRKFCSRKRGHNFFGASRGRARTKRPRS